MTSTPVDACSVCEPLSSEPTPHANSTTSSPRCTSPKASERTLPCWRVMTSATSSARSSSSWRNPNSTLVRLLSDAVRQSSAASRARRTTVAVSAAEARRTAATSSPVAGLRTGAVRSEVPAQAAPSCQWSMVGSTLTTGSPAPRRRSAARR